VPEVLVPLLAVQAAPGASTIRVLLARGVRQALLVAVQVVLVRMARVAVVVGVELLLLLLPVRVVLVVRVLKILLLRAAQPGRAAAVRAAVARLLVRLTVLVAQARRVACTAVAAVAVAVLPRRVMAATVEPVRLLSSILPRYRLA
jgi:hypothetical protein